MDQMAIRALQSVLSAKFQALGDPGQRGDDRRPNINFREMGGEEIEAHLTAIAKLARQNTLIQKYG